METGGPEAFNASTWLLDRRVEAGEGARVALRCGGRSVTYAELLEQVEAAGEWLVSSEVRPEERFLIAMMDGAEWVAAFLGGLRVGAVPVPVSTMLTGEDLGRLAADCRARVVLLSAELEDRAGAIAARAPEVAHLVVVGAPGAAPPWQAAVEDPARQGEGAGAARKARKAYATWADSPAFWLYTSGTTGSPKAAMHRHADLRTTVRTYADQVLGVGRDDVCYSVAKLFFAYGLGNSLTFPLAAGATSVLDPAKPTPEGVAAVAAAERPTLFFAVPTFYAALLSSGIPDDTFSSVRHGVSAGEPLPAELFHRFKERFGVEILDGLGSTELLHIFVSNRPGAVVPGTSGTPVPGYEVRLVDDDGAPVAGPGTPGHLLVRGDSAALGYWCRAEVSRRTFQGEWARTGDVYARSADGTYAYLGRDDDMMKAGGIWVSPAEVEAVLVEHPGVLEAAVVGLPDEHGIDKPVAFCVAVPGAELDAGDLERHCRERLASFKRPRRFAVLAELPKTATGKIQRYRL
ncbi:MAG: benzoate-CoA ligase family protein, partial [Acidimicrobiales bacterium]